MRKLFVAFMCFLPRLAIAAVDISDCQVIGYQRGTMTINDCNTIETCNVDFADFPEDLALCLKRAKTPEQCNEYIKERNAQIEKENLVYKCPMTVSRLKQRGKTKDHTVHNLVYNNGEAIDQEALANDNQYAYLFHGQSGLMGFVNKKRFSIIGAPEKYGLNMAIFDEE